MRRPALQEQLKGSPSGRKKKLMPDENMNLHKKMKTTRKSNCMEEYNFFLIV